MLDVGDHGIKRNKYQYTNKEKYKKQNEKKKNLCGPIKLLHENKVLS